MLTPFRLIQTVLRNIREKHRQLSIDDYWEEVRRYKAEDKEWRARRSKQ